MSGKIHSLSFIFEIHPLPLMSIYAIQQYHRSRVANISKTYDTRVANLSKTYDARVANLSKVGNPDDLQKIGNPEC